MLGLLEAQERRFLEVCQKLQQPDIAKDPQQYSELMKTCAEQEPLMELFKQWKRIQKEQQEAQALIEGDTDPALKELAQEELATLQQKLHETEELLQEQLLAPDQEKAAAESDKNVILEVRAGAGGDEAGLFAEQLFRAYHLYATKCGWKVEVLSLSEGFGGGYKEVVSLVSGKGAYGQMRYESGVHRVQRVPKTESQGRVHTSTVTVAVLPEAEEVAVEIKTEDVRVDVFRSSGAGGQHVNTTDSAVRLTHLPSGLVVSCQDEKSQIKNKNKAMRVLRSRLLDLEQERQREEASSERLEQIGRGDRSERIRTYNFPQTRLTDHRVGYTTHALEQIMNGDMETLFSSIAKCFREQAQSVRK